MDGICPIYNKLCYFFQHSDQNGLKVNRCAKGNETGQNWNAGLLSGGLIVQGQKLLKDFFFFLTDPDKYFHL